MSNPWEDDSSDITGPPPWRNHAWPHLRVRRPGSADGLDPVPGGSSVGQYTSALAGSDTGGGGGGGAGVFRLPKHANRDVLERYEMMFGTRSRPTPDPAIAPSGTGGITSTTAEHEQFEAMFGVPKHLHTHQGTVYL